MAYSSDIDILNPSHRYQLSSNANDSIGAANGTNSGGVFTGSQICEDATTSYITNGTTDRITLPSTTTINNSNHTRKAVAGWFMTTSIQTPPKRIYGEGNNSTCFQFMMAYGNNVMFEVVEPTNFTIQLYGPALQPNRIYHLCGIFEGNGFENEVRFYVDGVKMTLTEPDPAEPNTANLNTRGVGEFGDPAGTVGVGGDVVILNAPVNGQYSQWAMWVDADAQLTDDEVRKELFEKGALPGVTITSGTESNMQTQLNAIAATLRPNEALNIRVESLSGGGDLTLNADDITHDSLASIHVQYMGTDILTWRNTNGSDASIGSTPNGGVINFATPVDVEITVLDAEDLSAIEGARVRLIDETPAQLINDTTNASGSLSFVYDYISDLNISGRVRKGTNPIYYKQSLISGTISDTGLSLTVLMVKDE